MAASVNTYKLVLVGDGGVGKTTWVKKIRTNEFEPKYVATIGTESQLIRFETTDGQHFSFDVWDIAGQDKLGGRRDAYYIGADCAVLMHDLTDDDTCVHIKKWDSDVKRVCNRDGKNIPIIVVGNKRDMSTSTRQLSRQISTKEDKKKELLQPLVELARYLKGDFTLELKTTTPAFLNYRAFFP